MGFSYSDTNPDRVYNDTQTALDTLEALKQFFVRFPEHVPSPFYVTGESYGGTWLTD